MPFYRAFGLTINSALNLPFLMLALDATTADIQFKVSNNMSSLLNDYGFDESKRLQFQPNKCLFLVPDVARFLISEGNSITIEILTDDIDHVGVYLMGTAMTILLYQRNLTIIHANSVVIQNRAVLIMAPSGYGKSTLAAAFLHKGYEILSDDMCVIDIQNNTAMVQPGYPQIKLCDDAMMALGYQPNQYKQIKNSNKYYIPIHSIFHQKPVEIAGFVQLDRSNISHCSLRDIVGHEKFKVLWQNSHRKYIILRLQKQLHYSKHYLSLIESLPFKLLTRPENCFSAFELVEKIVNAFSLQHVGSEAMS